MPGSTSSWGTAVISLHLPPTANCPSAKRCSAAQAVTKWSGSLQIGHAYRFRPAAGHVQDVSTLRALAPE